MKLNQLINDKIARGIIAGIIAGIIMEIINYPLYKLELLTLRPIDFSIMIIKHHGAKTMLDIVTGFVNHLFFASTSGIILSYILSYSNYRLPLLKGMGIGLGTNIMLLVMASFFKIKAVTNLPTRTILALNISAATAFGLTAGYILNYFHKRFDLALK
ncbi:hypothetical protein [Acetohalobium arabaticum]|uniref:Uncharacterized protein n=1 Tax=Acetohalobium arabaticum (strain ATCC 49924 / DSM 5501 / Z-7288) TaxID=574087 RepID=D9QQG1_ACEAZ|nr:hypothetical protein [Acetohalobium arabaticum]ADL12752.1 hypothetical protein Acear_1235 [Acetohalobium arabaticum DSM 5501]